MNISGCPVTYFYQNYVLCNTHESGNDNNGISIYLSIKVIKNYFFSSLSKIKKVKTCHSELVSESICINYLDPEIILKQVQYRIQNGRLVRLTEIY